MTDTKRHIKLAAYLLVATILITFSPQQCLADLYSGSLNAGNGGGLSGFEAWNDSKTKITWQVTPYANYYEYYYKFEVPNMDGSVKGLSHIIFQVSDNFTRADYLSTSPIPLGPATYTDDIGNSNPGLPGSIFGIKFEDIFDEYEDYDADGKGIGDPISMWELTFQTKRVPMWGDFYAKDGKDGSNDVYVYNTSIGLEHTAINPYHIAVPDTKVIPVPPAVLLGMLGMSIAGVKLRKYA